MYFIAKYNGTGRGTDSWVGVVNETRARWVGRLGLQPAPPTKKTLNPPNKVLGEGGGPLYHRTTSLLFVHPPRHLSTISFPPTCRRHKKGLPGSNIEGLFTKSIIWLSLYKRPPHSSPPRLLFRTLTYQLFLSRH